MTSIRGLDYSISVPSNLPLASQQMHVKQKPESVVPSLASCPDLPLNPSGHFYMDKGGIRTGDWKNSFMRWFVPRYASDQDQKVTEYLINFFKNCFSDNLENNKEKFKSMIVSAEHHIACGRGWFSRSVSEDIARLEVYTLAARDRIHTFEPGHSREALLEKCRTDNLVLYNHWKKLGFAEEAFWTSPDLVDFLFKAHLHRYITHPYYKHTIDTRPCLVRRDGKLTVSREPHLLVNGTPTPWSGLRNLFKLNSEGKVYTIENDQKKFWMYLENGFTLWDRHHFQYPDHLHRLRHLDKIPSSNKIEVITTRVHKKDRAFYDHVLKGFRHSFFRIIPGEGFSARHSRLGLGDGGVYSFGWAARVRDFYPLLPLTTKKGGWSSPDAWEFIKEDLYVTPMDISDEQLVKVMEIIQERNLKDLPFQIINSNCAEMTTDILSKAGIVRLSPKEHFADLWYQFLVPKFLREVIGKVTSFISRWAPNFFSNGVSRLANFIHSTIWAPIFSLLGAWRTRITFEDENEREVAVRARNTIKALFTHAFDMFDPNKMALDLPKNLYKWQKTYSETYIEKHD